LLITYYASYSLLGVNEAVSSKAAKITGKLEAVLLLLEISG
jgi:hypothetical protein